MNDIVWNDKMRTGVAFIDAEHKELVEMAKRLAMAVRSGDADAVAVDLFEALVDYAKRHFRNEEILMSSHGYPDSKNHKANHEKLMEELTRLRLKGREEAGVGVGSKTVDFVNGWLALHIQGTDGRLGEWLNSRGVR